MDLRAILNEAIATGEKAKHECEESLKARAGEENWTDLDSCGFTWIRLKDCQLFRSIEELDMPEAKCSFLDGDLILRLKTVSDYFFFSCSYDALQAVAHSLNRHGINAAVDCRAD